VQDDSRFGRHCRKSINGRVRFVQVSTIPSAQ